MKDAENQTEAQARESLRVFDADPLAGQSPQSLRFAVVVPCYNEEGAILETIASLRRHLRNTGPYQLIVVNDGSTDRTGELLKAAVQQDRDLCVLTHARNRGYGAALKTAIRQTSAELIVITDADGTYPNEQIPKLVQMAQDADMVVGSRTAPNAQYPAIRKLPKVFLRAYASWIAGTHIPDLNSGLRVFRRELARHFLYLLPDGFSFTTTITLAMLTHESTVRYHPIGYAPRIGKSKIRPIRDTLRFFHLIIRMGVFFAPMRTLMPLSFALFGLFSASLLYDVVLERNLTDKTVVLLMFSMNTVLFALLADVIHLISKRSVLEQHTRGKPSDIPKAGAMRPPDTPHRLEPDGRVEDDPRKQVAA
jgi:glycosyltransferase involved in cell wall biosynthesis